MNICVYIYTQVNYHKSPTQHVQDIFEKSIFPLQNHHKKKREETGPVFFWSVSMICNMYLH